ncbi:hypothetical protein, partial [Jatrophihabitans sp.]|uniref:hypothetical protein n=1 Tax=Jatrophihabitans sp. TaxID=1932789 RepID=UPI0030C65A16|nr:hypothetical protein [Jatrophihabitans sp.]
DTGGAGGPGGTGAAGGAALGGTISNAGTLLMSQVTIQSSEVESRVDGAGGPVPTAAPRRLPRLQED